MVYIPKHERVNGKALTREEERLLVEKSKNHRFGDIYLKMLYTGVRTCEVNSIVENIEENTLTVKNGKLKNYQKNLYRTIPMFPNYKPLATGEPINVSEQKLSDEFSSICPNHTLKDLRHTFTTRARECRIDNELVAVWTGHSLGNITASVYTHFSMEYQQDEAKKLLYNI